MAHNNEHPTIPRAAVAGAVALVVVSVIAVYASRATGVGIVTTPASLAVDSRRLVFEDSADGSVIVQDAEAGAIVHVVEPGTNGFLRGVLRGLARDRKLKGVGSGPPFVLTRWADGRLTLADPQTDRRIDLAPFGAENVQVFVNLLTGGAAHDPRTTAMSAERVVAKRHTDETGD